MKRTLCLATVGFGLLIAAALPAGAATWSATTPLSPAGANVEFAPSVAIDDAGFGVAAWSDDEGGKAVIRVAEHPPGGAWATSPTVLSASFPGMACEVFTSIDPQGDALVAWAQYSGSICDSGNQMMLFATRGAADGAWSAPQAAGTSHPDGQGPPAAASNELGQMVLAWETTEGAESKVYATVGSPTAGFQPQTAVEHVGSGVSVSPLAVGIGPNADAAVQWPEDSSLRIAVTQSGGQFLGSSSVSVAAPGSGNAKNGSVTVDGAGNILSTYWLDATDTVTSRYMPAGGAFLTSQIVAPAQANFTLNGVSVAFDGTGNATVAWLEQSTVATSTGRIFTATRAVGPSSPWAGNAPLADTVSVPGVPVVAVAESGAAVIGWSAFSTQHGLVFTRPASGSFGPAQDLGACTSTVVALAPGGDALAGCDETNAGPARVSVFDAQQPTIAAINVPSTAVAGQPAAMSMTLSDLWSGLGAGQPVWNFGDGTAGAGSPVAHTYAAAGTYVVTVTAANSAGTAATGSATETITVAAAAAQPGGGGGNGGSGGENGGGGGGSSISIAKPSVKAVYVGGKLDGSVGLSGTSATATKLSIAISKAGAKKALATSTLTIKAGKWSKTIKLPASLLPGSYTVTASGKGVSSTSASFTIPVPKTGITNQVYASGAQHGPAATKLASTSQLWAHFSFRTVPKKGLTITTQWTLPSGAKLGANTRPHASLVEAQVRDLKGHALPSGKWHCVLRVGGTVVATATVRVG
jgi:PKD repeat protein